MNDSTAIHAAAPRPLLSATLRIGAAAAVAAVTVLAVTIAQHESHQAVQNAAELLSRSTVHVTLPPVEVVGRRERPGIIRGGAAG